MKTETTSHIILGIDPGTNIMGYSLLKTHARNSEIITLDIINLKNSPTRAPSSR